MVIACGTSSSAFSAISLGFTFLCEIFAYVRVSFFFFVCLFGFKSNHRSSQIPSSWMVPAGCVFVVGIHQSSAFSAISLGFTFLCEIFAYVTGFVVVFFNPTIEVVKFPLRRDGACWVWICCRHSQV